MTNYHHILKAFISFYLLLLLSSCQSAKLEDQILGTWVDIEGDQIQLTINDDGTATVENQILKWTINENSELILQEDGKSERLKIKFVEDILSPNGRMIVLDRKMDYEASLFKKDDIIESKEKEGFRAGIEYNAEKYPQNTDMQLFQSIQTAINAGDLYYLFAHLIITLDDAWNYIDPETRSFRNLAVISWMKLCAMNYDSFKVNPAQLNQLNRGVESILDGKYVTEQNKFTTSYYIAIIKGGVEFEIANIEGRWYVLKYEY